MRNNNKNKEYAPNFLGVGQVSRRKDAGFTIVEVLVSLAIVTIGLLGVSSLVVQNMQVQYVNGRYLIASMLAQEGLELVRNVRDKNWLTMGNDWDDYLMGGTPSSPGDGTYTVDYQLNIDDTPDNIDDPLAKLYLNGSGFYDHNNVGVSTPFSRLITVSKNGGQRIVRAEVKWWTSQGIKIYIAETYLYDWR